VIDTEQIFAMLVARSQGRGTLTFEELSEVFRAHAVSAMQIEDIMARLTALEIEVVDPAAEIAKALRDRLKIKSMTKNLSAVDFEDEGEGRRPTMAELVEGWISLQELYDHDEALATEKFWWAYECALVLCQRYPNVAFEFVLAVLAKKPSEDVLGVLAAGPLEDALAVAGHCDVLIERVEEEARRNPSFRSLLSGVWKYDMADDLWQRLQAAAGRTEPQQP
jgi:hypothetical protein